MGMQGLGESLEEEKGDRMRVLTAGLGIRMPLVARGRSLSLLKNWRRLACK